MPELPEVAGLVAFLGARLRPRFDVVFHYLAFDELLDEAARDLIDEATGPAIPPRPRTS